MATPVAEGRQATTGPPWRNNEHKILYRRILVHVVGVVGLALDRLGPPMSYLPQDGETLPCSNHLPHDPHLWDGTLCAWQCPGKPASIMIPYAFDVPPSMERVQARKDAAKWMAEHNHPLDGWEILGLETILITGKVPPH